MNNWSLKKLSAELREVKVCDPPAITEVLTLMVSCSVPNPLPVAKESLKPKSSEWPEFRVMSAVLVYVSATGFALDPMLSKPRA